MLALRPNCECCDKDLPPDAPDGLPRKKCPVCGAVLDFDYGRCPYCEHEF